MKQVLCILQNAYRFPNRKHTVYSQRIVNRSNATYSQILKATSFRDWDAMIAFGKQAGARCDEHLIAEVAENLS